jgi:hypothetical protein
VPGVDNRVGVITEGITPRWGEGTEFRMIRSERFKYIAFRDCDDLAFNLDNDPDEQVNIAADPEFHEALTPLKTAVMEGFSFDDAETLRKEQNTDLKQRFPAKFKPVTPNQILLGDGRLVEADAPLYQPDVLSDDLSRDLEDWPGRRSS